MSKNKNIVCFQMFLTYVKPPLVLNFIAVASWSGAKKIKFYGISCSDTHYDLNSSSFPFYFVFF